MAKFLIADASALIFRGSVIKSNTNVNYPGGWSFLSRTVFQKIKEISPTHVLIAGDGYNSSESRRKVLNNYKKHRPPCPELIKYQLENLGNICNKMNIKFVSQELHEADDVINTFVQQALKKQFNSIHIIGDDKDLYCLLSDPRVEIHRLTKPKNTLQVPENHKIQLPNLQIFPYQIPDFLALVGDAVDNIPGCPQIGIKRAQWLLSEYKDIDTIFNNLDDIKYLHKKRTIGMNLEQNRETIQQGLTLTKLKDLSGLILHELDDMIFDMDKLDTVEEEISRFICEPITLPILD